MDELPTMKKLEDFLNHSSLKLPMISKAEPTKLSSSTSTEYTKNKKKHKADKPHSGIKCPHCKDKHNHVRCKAYVDLDIDKRWKVVKDKRLCHNCLADDHSIKNCSSKYNCRHCDKRHHSFLHRTSDDPESAVPAMSVSTKSSIKVTSGETAIALATAGTRFARVRLLLDSGSATSVISDNLASTLKLKRTVGARLARNARIATGLVDSK